MDSKSQLSQLLGKGLAWSSINAVVMRIGTFAVGIFLARILAPEEFGVFAIALTVQAVLMTLADFGLSSDLIRSKNHAEKAPTVATMGLVMGTFLFLAMWSTAGGTARLLGTPEAEPVIALMSASLIMAGLSVVPYAKLHREFQQKRVFAVSVIDFVVVNTLTVVLVLSGWGVMALAFSRIASQLVSLVSFYILAGMAPKFGFDKKLAPEILAFGIPVAGANFLSWVLLSSDNIVISNIAGPVLLGYYYLAFNISNWPMSIIGQVVRSVALPTFSYDRARNMFPLAISLTWPLTLMVGAMLSLLAGPVINVVYGEKWASAVPLLVVLGVFGSIRTLFDIAVSFLLAKGHSTQTLVVQAVWLGVLLISMIWLTAAFGPMGAAMAHLACALVVVGPMYLLYLRKAGVDLRALMASLWPPVAAMLPAVAAVTAMNLVLDFSNITKFLVGGFAGTAIYAACIHRWYLRALRKWREAATADGSMEEISPEHVCDDRAASPVRVEPGIRGCEN